MFMGANSPMLGHGLFLKWTRLQRLFSRLPIHFLCCLSFKLKGFFLGCLGFCIGCLNFVLGFLVLFISYLIGS